ncbi:MAG: hypothetical protein IJM59_06390 [Proteobacteria bacterium]|nr:hypothetical protein [Pseudomonadota bacterium]
MKPTVFFLSLFVMLMLVPSAVLADDDAFECTLTLEYEGASIQTTQKASTALKAMTNAIHSGCSKLCTTVSENNKICINSCVSNARFQHNQCTDSSRTEVVMSPENARKHMIPDNSGSSDYELMLPKSPKTPLLLTTWVGNTDKSSNTKKHSLILNEQKNRKKLILTPPQRKSPLLLK